MNKKGAELSMNVIIIAILVILVLVIVAFFFTGGMAGLLNKIKGIFSGTVPDDLSIAKTTCETNCKLTQGLSQNEIESSIYCKNTWRVDTDEDDKADTKARCWSDTINVPCPGVDELCGEDDEEPL